MAGFLSGALQAVLFALQIGLVVASPAPNVRGSSPVVTLDKATFTGSTDGVTNKFLGIPFAKPPTGDLRFRQPVANDPYTGAHSATDFGFTCPQQSSSLLGDLTPNFPIQSLVVLTGVLHNATQESEDCLTLNVIQPAGVKPGSKLPVAVWIYGGGFETGATSSFDGGPVVQRSIELNEPIIYVSMNYRLSALGFLAGKEVQRAGVANLGLHDQRSALQWVQKYIHAFGGDPSKVTIWGESAGAISVALQMLTNNGRTGGLFRGAFMESGSPIVSGDLAGGQKFYDQIVAQVGCSKASDTLQCLRGVPFDQLKAAMNATPNLFSFSSVSLVWGPRIDGTFIPEDPMRLVQQGSVASVPFVTGDCDDEGTLFALSSTNITDEAGTRQYMKDIFFPNAPDSAIDQLLQLYPANITQGSPFDTGTANALTPEFKRIAAILGDFTFHSPRRFFLQARAGQQNTWSFLSKRHKDLPALGSAHSSDLLNVYGPGDLTDILINFVNHLNPNGPTILSWPNYNPRSPKLLTLLDGQVPQVITEDTFRKDATLFVTKLSFGNPTL